MFYIHKLMVGVVVLFIGLLPFQSNGQTSDSLPELNAEQVLEIVRKYHPVSRQTDLGIEQAQADLLVAKGGFDPVISAYLSRKKFGGTEYYQQASPQLSIPTWFGVEIHSGLENLRGTRTDPTMTPGKSSYLGLTVPLAKDLLMDKRRAYLKQARIYTTMAATEQRAAVNDLLMEAMDAYWVWVRAYQIYKVVENNVAINERRMGFVRQSFLNGETPAIDTVEAVTQLQSFQFLQNDKWLEFQNAGLELSAFLWTKDTEPFDLPVNVIPHDGWENEASIRDFSVNLEELLNLASKSHPEIQLYDSKLDALAIEKKLKFQSLLPKADFTYNHLSKGYGLVDNEYLAPFFDNNFRYGFKFAVPLRLSEGRGEYRKARIKIESTQLDLDQKRLGIQLKLKSYYNELTNLRTQIALQSSNYLNYQQLVRAEETRFQSGESSLFLINTRENKALEAQQKLLDLKTKYFKTVYALQWSAGLLVL